MCGLFGIKYYGNGKLDYTMKNLLESLGHESTVRGTDATGIAFNHKGKMVVKKAPKSAYDFKFSIPEGVKTIMGHTRRTTQGNAKHNHNNHPFLGKAKNTNFAFAHNGVLDNDFVLRKRYNLKSKIETDSYVAVQLLEMYGELNMENIIKMSEEVEGMFTFTLLDQEENLIVIKNDSPFALVNLPSLQMYAYASTPEILFRALMDNYTTRDIILDVMRKKDPSLIEFIEPKVGDILTIKKDGTIEYDSFTPSYRWDNYYYGRNSWARRAASYNGYSRPTTTRGSILPNYKDENEYEKLLMDECINLGITKEEFQLLRDYGFSLLEIEEAIRDYSIFDLVDEVVFEMRLG